MYQRDTKLSAAERVHCRWVLSHGVDNEILGLTKEIKEQIRYWKNPDKCYIFDIRRKYGPIYINNYIHDSWFNLLLLVTAVWVDSKSKAQSF